LILDTLGKINSGDEDYKYSRGGLILALFVSWTELLLVIGQLNYSVSVFTYAFVQIILELAPFALTSSLVVLAFSQVYFIAGSDLDICKTDESSTWQCSETSSLFQSFSMLLTTDYQFMQWEDPKDQTLLSIISFAFAIVVGILLLNILIAIVNNQFTRVSEESENAFWTTRLDFMNEINAIYTSMIRLVCSGKSDDKTTGGDTYDLYRFRFDFIQYDDDWVKLVDENDLHINNFFKWWYYAWKKECPPLSTRLMYFYTHASMSEILFPGKVFHNVLFGLKYNEEIKGLRLSVALFLSLFHMIIGLITMIVIFVLGLFTWGILWPKEINKVLFFGPVGPKDTKRKSGRRKIKQKF